MAPPGPAAEPHDNMMPSRRRSAEQRVELAEQTLGSTGEGQGRCDLAAYRSPRFVIAARDLRHGR